eukprot:TRINITY_DN29859_c0_g1_i2.p1 TRINITY_DN29859_c0_g1~~TRINITY_DN29859_c0_g1_i2.p1  ORF type:complete len:250 (+),score=25.83 TRINITY_DN29859_c0_g1_i2:26-775(+)
MAGPTRKTRKPRAGTPGRRRQDLDPEELEDLEMLRRFINPGESEETTPTSPEIQESEPRTPGGSHGDYLEDLRVQMRQNEARKRRQEQEELADERRLVAERNATYRRGGGGSPLRDSSGDIVTRRRPMSSVTGQDAWAATSEATPTQISSEPDPERGIDKSCGPRLHGYQGCGGCAELREQTRHLAIEVGALQEQMGQLLGMFLAEKKRNNELSGLLLRGGSASGREALEAMIVEKECRQSRQRGESSS